MTLLPEIVRRPAKRDKRPLLTFKCPMRVFDAAGTYANLLIGHQYLTSVLIRSGRRLQSCHSVLVAKYDPLFEYLCKAGDAPVTITFDEIERMVGALPTSATKYPAWWGNEAGAGRHAPRRGSTRQKSSSSI